MAKYRNNTGQTSKLGYICKVDPRDNNAFVYASTSDINVLGVIAESVPDRAMCEIIKGGTAYVSIFGRANHGDTIRLYKPKDNISHGPSIVAKIGDSPYLRIGTALESGKGLVKCNINFGYVSSGSQEVAGTRIRFISVDGAEIPGDGTIVANSATDISFYLNEATGSGRELKISNLGAGLLTVYTAGDASDPSNLDTIDGATTLDLAQYITVEIKDVSINTWIAMGDSSSSSSEEFETVSKNLKSYPYVLTYGVDGINTITYDLGGGQSVVKTFNYTLSVLTSIVLSGDTPSGIELTKTLSYTGADLTGVVYS